MKRASLRLVWAIGVTIALVATVFTDINDHSPRIQLLESQLAEMNGYLGDEGQKLRALERGFEEHLRHFKIYIQCGNNQAVQGYLDPKIYVSPGNGNGKGDDIISFTIRAQDPEEGKQCGLDDTGIWGHLTTPHP